MKTNLNFTSKKQLIVADFKCFFRVLRLLETNDRMSVLVLTNDVHPRDLPVLLVLVKQTVLK